MEKFRLKILPPEGTVIDKEASGLYLRGANGDLAVFSGHVPFITPVKAGNCTIVSEEAAGASSKNSKEDDYNDLECSIGEGMLRVSTKEVLLLVKSFEQRNL